jgi:tetratricopeptide (TPR) repeat protein
MKKLTHTSCLVACIVLFFISCKTKNENQYSELISSIDLKRGEIVSCSPQGAQFGEISFAASLAENLKTDFNTAVALLHSFEYDEAEKMFTKVIDKEPRCAMAWWGVAMSNFHPLWAPPTQAELSKGAKAINIARSIDNKTKRESDYIEAIGAFYQDTANLDHHSRVLNFEKAMEKIYLTYREDKEAPVFYALALNAAADPADKTYARQKKAFTILNTIFEQEPLHPGIAHYIIHNYDYPDLAGMALPAAKKYASIAPASAHAQHMPSHIFTRLGLWDDCIQSNLAAASSAKCYAEQANIKGHWDEELHALDYLMYAYLQKGDDGRAKEQLDYLQTITEVHPVNFKVLYAFAAMPARYFLERRMWNEASTMEPYPANFPWEKFSWQKAVIHFTRGLGAVHAGKIEEAKTELKNLIALHGLLSKEKNMSREAAQVAVQINAAEAWIQYKEGNNDKALNLMTKAADMEDGTEKHPVTPGEVIPARELLGDMLLEMNKPALALEAYKSVLKTHPNRLNGLYGAGMAAYESGNKEETSFYFKKLLTITAPTSTRQELKKSRVILSSLNQS